jgi:hypothetical protein
MRAAQASGHARGLLCFAQGFILLIYCSSTPKAEPSAGGSTPTKLGSVLLDPSPDTAHAFGLTASGRFAVADFAKAKLALYSSDGRRERVIAGPGRGFGELIRPIALATLGDEIFVYDIGKGNLLRYDRDGNCVLDEFQPRSSVTCPFVVHKSTQFRVGGLVLPDKRLCPVYSANITGSSGFRPLVCYDSRKEYDLFGFEAGCGYVDTAGGEIYVAIPFELQVRVLDMTGRPLRAFGIGGSSAKRPSADGMTAQRAAIASELWAWRSSFTFVDGLAAVPGRVVVLVQDPKPDLGWRLEVTDRNGRSLGTTRVADGAMKDNRSVRLTGDHDGSVFVLVRQAEPGGAGRYRVEKYLIPRN